MEKGRTSKKENLSVVWVCFGEPQRPGMFTSIYRDASVKPQVGTLQKEKERVAKKEEWLKYPREVC